MSKIRTRSGRLFDVLNMPYASIDIEDIAHSLSMQCRYNGHCSRFYSVAEHSCLLHDYALDELEDLDLARALLLHDASEAYLSDIPSPIKPLLANYSVLEAAVQREIARKFGTIMSGNQGLDDLDKRICSDEMAALFTGWENKGREPLGVTLKFWLPDEAKKEFLDRFYRSFRCP
jgi:hypothetical protein